MELDMNGRSPKSFWKRPEGVAGAITLGGVCVAGLYGFSKILPWLITMMQNTLHAAFLAAVVGGILFVVMDPKFRTLVSFAYKGMMRKMTGMLIELDPIRILRVCIDEMIKNRSEMNKQIENLRGQMRKLQNIITDNKAEHDNNMSLAAQAKKKNIEQEVTVKTRAAGRLHESNKTLTALYTRMELLYRMLSKMFETAGYLIEDTKGEVDVKERERNAILASHSALRSAMKILSGDPDKKMMFDQAMEFMVDDIGQKAGEMERMMEVSSTFLDGIDLQNGVFEEDGLKMLEKWEKESFSTLMLGSDTPKLIAATQDSNQVLDLDAPISEVAVVSRNNKYSDLIK